MGDLNKGYEFGATEEVTAAKLHSLIDDGSVSGIVSADITDSTITDAKIASVGGSKLISLSGIPAGAGDIPEANLPTTITQATTMTDLTITTASITSGTLTTADINGGTLDGVQIGGTTATGELIVNDSNDDADGLGSQGTTGQFLTSAGAGANPTWTTGISLIVRDDTSLSAVLATAPTVRTSTSKSRVKIKEIENWTLTGTVSVSWLMKSSNAGIAANAIVYVNGSEVGSEQTTNSTTDVVKSSTAISVVPGDKIQIYGNIASGTVDYVTISAMKVNGGFASETSGL